MNKVQSSLLETFLSIKQFGEENLAELNVLVDFNSCFNPFLANIEAIHEAVGRQGLDNSGFGIMKKQKRELLAKLIEKLSIQKAYFARIWASFIKNSAG